MGWKKNTYRVLIEIKPSSQKEFSLAYYMYNDSDSNEPDIELIYEDCKNQLRHKVEDKDGYEFVLKKDKRNTCIIDYNKNMDFIALHKLIEFAQNKNYIIVVNNFILEKGQITNKLGFFYINFIGSFTIREVTFNERVIFYNNNFLCHFTLITSTTKNGLYIGRNYFAGLIYLFNNYLDSMILSNIRFVNQKGGKELTNNNQVLDYYRENYNYYFNNKENKAEFRETCNYIKNHFIQQNNYIDSNTFYALEMLARGKELNFLDTPWEWVVFYINEVTSNHGQSILRPLVLILMLAISWGLDSRIFIEYDIHFNMTDFISIAFPITDVIKMDDNDLPNNGWCKLAYVLSKVFSAVLWWQLIRAIRKDIKR